MIEEAGRVIAVEGDQAWVRTIQVSTCQSCAARKGCGHGLMNSLGEGRATQVRVPNVLGVSVGDDVVLGVPETALLGASALMYLVPLLTMILAAVATRQWFTTADGWIALAGLVGLAAGFVLVGQVWAPRAQGLDFQPRLLRRVVADEHSKIAACSLPTH